jgi:hypothetical protein
MRQTRYRTTALLAATFLLSSLAPSCGGEKLGPGPAELSKVEIPVAPPFKKPKPKPRAAVRAATSPAIPVTKPAPPPTFADDLAYLQKHGDVHVLEGAGGARVVLSAKYQGRVMTSAVDASGRSFGWINRAFIDAGKTGTPFDNYGGEDRFWLGPEAGQFGLYFAPGKPFAFDQWKVPASLQEGAWTMSGATPKRAVFKKSVSVTNGSGTKLTADVERTIALVEPDAAKKALGFDALRAPGVKSVAFESQNKITNAGKEPWKKETGLVSVWILGMFAPAEDGEVIVPFRTGKDVTGPIVNDRYFGEVPKDRLKVKEDKGYLLFSIDGKLRSKIGLGPLRAKRVVGAYSPSQKALTIVQYDPPPAAPGGKAPPYVNSMWEQQKDPYAGDVVNSYNDGPTGPGKPPLGGFFEIETSSPGAELAPGKSLVHTHRTFHFVGEPSALEPIAKAVLGVSLADVTAK